MACRSADELAGFRRKQIGNGTGVTAFERLAGQDHGPTIDVGAIETGIGVALCNEPRQRFRVDGEILQIGREQNRRLRDHLAIDHDKTARQSARQSLQMHACKHQMRGRRADVDADRGQLHIVGTPGDLVPLLARVDVQMLEFKIVHGHCRRRQSPNGSHRSIRR